MAKTKPTDVHHEEFGLEVVNQDGTPLNGVETAAYISDILLQLRNMAKTANLKYLVYFLEMAFQEAFSQSTGGDVKKNVK